MKKILLSLFIFGFIISIASQNLSVLIDYKSYCSPSGEPYLEISSIVNGQTVQYVPDEDGKFHAEVRITVQAFQSDSLINKLDYILLSESFDNPETSTKPNFGDIQNFQIENGEYLLQFSVQDINTENMPFYFVDVATLDYYEDKVSISDISLYKSFSREPSGDIFDKYGLSFEPLLYGFVSESMYNLPFTCEIYNTDNFANTEQLTIKSYITSFENNLMPFPEAIYITNKKASRVIIVLGEIGIFKLPSGNYNLNIEVYSQDSYLLASNTFFFQRSNPKLTLNFDDFENVYVDNSFVAQIQDSEKLLEYVRFLYPISSSLEKEFYTLRLKNTPEETLRKFFYAFWLRRDPHNPESAWKEYLAKVEHVNRVFGCKLKQGYRTDRGRVYLQYGPPNSIVESPFDSHSYPYEVWHYYYCIDQPNVKFIFCNTDFVSNDYDLIHSNRKGEIQDPMWQIRVTFRKVPVYNFEETTPEDLFGGNPKDDWFINR